MPQLQNLVSQVGVLHLISYFFIYLFIHLFILDINRHQIEGHRECNVLEDVFIFSVAPA